MAVPKPKPILKAPYDEKWLALLLQGEAEPAISPPMGGTQQMGNGSWALGGGSWPLGSAWPLGGHSWSLGGGSWPLGGNSWPLGGSTSKLGGSSWPLGAGSWALGNGSWPLPAARGTGYRPDLPDHRDYSRQTLPKHIEKKLKALAKKKKCLTHFLQEKDPPMTDHTLNTQGEEKVPRVNIGDYNLCLWPIEDQGPFQSCTANAVIGLAEFLLRKAQIGVDIGKEERINLSRFFLYKTTRQLLGWTGDTGAYLRTTIKAMALFGAPPEEYWPYSAAILDAEPTPFSFHYAQQFKALAYVRLDSNGTSGGDTLTQVRRVLADGFPVVFGFPLYKSVQLMGEDCFIPPPNVYPYDTLVGGHAVMAVGYDDTIEFQYPGADGTMKREVGALIIRNSWGYTWGDYGFAYLPYCYVINGLACDFWTIFSEGTFKQSPFDD